MADGTCGVGCTGGNTCWNVGCGAGGAQSSLAQTIAKLPKAERVQPE